jgi:hypothetical protein
MTENLPINVRELIELNNIDHPEWHEPIVCRVEVDLPGWLAQLTGGQSWEVYGEDEEETCISFALRELPKPNHCRRDNVKPVKEKLNAKSALKLAPKLASKLAEVTLYHNGYAVVDVDGTALFDGTLTNGTSDCAHLTYFHAESGEPITLN